MGRDNWRVERTGHSPWGALALVLLTGLAWMQNGADFSLGPPRLVAATSVDLRRAAPKVPVAVVAVKPHLTGPQLVRGSRALNGAAAP
ncbi:hypothetical protein ABT115_24590 [Streptomyces sp. NPDC001832]|uniref:hypothetical protein n=1 Tax=Streptomyces sp. NPDC001832 TaxID=3154527 RepID=UPI0033296B1D